MIAVWPRLMGGPGAPGWSGQHGALCPGAGGGRALAAHGTARRGAEPRWAAAGAPPLILPGSATAEVTEIAALGFVIAGILNAVVNTRAVARYLGGDVDLSNPLGPTTVRTRLAATATLGASADEHAAYARGQPELPLGLLLIVVIVS
ncbi:MAG TPA: hypothetical protein VKF37_11320 [Chloroflexota bacterium]|nr:hypothetical protein [Chloroflexota bacterium]